LDADRLGILIVNTNIKHALADGGGYASRRKECEAAALQLSGGRTSLLRDVSPIEYSDGIESVEQPAQNRARHVWDENGRVQLGTSCLENGDIVGFGAQLNASHASCRLLFENTCSEIDNVQAILEHTDGVYGAKLSGGGWGGSVVAVINPTMVDSIVTKLKSDYGDGLSILATSASVGAQGMAL
jgi:galactokinase